MAQICVTLGERTTSGVIRRMGELSAQADLFEVRGDLVSDLHLGAIAEARARPLVFSFRPRDEGGLFDGRPAERRMALMEAVKHGYEFVDVEHRSDFMDVIIEKRGNGLLLSYHDLEGTPEDLRSLYDAMAQRGADVIKIVVTPRTIADVARLLELAASVAGRPWPSLIAIALGPLGVPTRLLAGRYGAPFTYACAEAGEEVAPGQLPAKVMADIYRVREVDPQTRVFGLVGADVLTSLSPVIHNRAFAARKLNAVYVPLQVDTLDAFMQARLAFGLSGFGVTRPYKVEIVRYVQELEETAALCGSVNTVVAHEDGLRGSTTDGQGVLFALPPHVDVKGRSALVLGAGGAARSAALALGRRGAEVTILARSAAKAAAVAAAIGCGYGSLANLERHDWHVLINATPLGSYGLLGDTPVPAPLHRPGTVVLDMVYEPVETRLLREAREAGCLTIDGRHMLLGQAIGQFEAWTGLEAPIDVMREAIFGAPQGAP